MQDRPSKKECFTAIVAACCWLAVIVIALVCTSFAAGAQGNVVIDVQRAVCRVYNSQGGSSDVGSGTLIDKTADGREGMILTCAHLFREGIGKIIVEYPNGKSHGAKLIDVDHQADLAALAIANPSEQPVPVARTFSTTAKLHACGYGPRGAYRCAVGPVIGNATDSGQISLMIGDPVRSGDSGGGVFDDQGRLVAVIWGETQGVTYASTGKPLQKFLSRVLGRRTGIVYRCPDGVCPAPPGPNREEHSILVDPRWQQLQAQIKRLQEEKQDRGDYLTRTDLDAFALSADVERVE
ncbi:MAG: serine protease, partial [Pirellulales bacterium]|nr:serine protease [Pirellulales bacterium]